MRKKFFSVFVLLLTLSLISCGNTINQDVASSDTLDENTISTTEYIQVWPGPESEKTYRINTIEEYKEYVSMIKELPETFIRYEDISYLGDFSAFVYYNPHDPNSSDFYDTVKRYSYEFNDGQFRIEFNHGKFDSWGEYAEKDFGFEYVEFENIDQDDLTYKSGISLLNTDIYSEYRYGVSKINVNIGYYEDDPLPSLFVMEFPCYDMSGEELKLSANIFFREVPFDDMYATAPFDYDYSNEELNKFLNKSTLTEALHLFYMSYTYGPENRYMGMETA